MTRRAIPLVPALIVGLFVCSPAVAQTEDPVTIDIDATVNGTPLRLVWACFGYDEANYTTTPEGQVYSISGAAQDT